MSSRALRWLARCVAVPDRRAERPLSEPVVPGDRAGWVATEIDLAWTYVGGPAALISDVLANSRLEASPAARPVLPLRVAADLNEKRACRHDNPRDDRVFVEGDSDRRR